ncbi:MAG: SIMPL domain-containing protein, partial [Chloroflexota bacterium]
ENRAALTLSARPITTTGDAEIRVAPDEVIVILGVETWDKNIQIAKKQNDDRIKRITALTKDFGIDPNYVQTDQINVEPRYRNGYYTDADFIGYFIRKTMVITLKDVSKFEDVFTGALGAGATHVQGVQFRTTELRKYRDQARALAIKAAKEKASALAGELGRKIGEPQSIQENSATWWSSYSSRWGGAMTQNVMQNVGGGSAFGDEGTFAPGQISISARVTVTFDLE